MELFEKAIQQCLEVLQAGGLIQFPADWGLCIGCDATHDTAVNNLRHLLLKGATRELPVLLSEERDVLQYVAAVDLSVFDFAAQQDFPLVIRFENGLGFADSLPAPDGSVLIGLTRDALCRHLVKRFRKPIVALPVDVVDESNGTDPVLPGSLRTAIAHNFQQPIPEGAGAKGLQVLEWNNGEANVRQYK